VLVPWTPLSPSRRERGLRRIGQAFGFLTSAALLSAAVRSDPFDPLPALAAVLALLAGLWAGRAASPESLEVGVDRAGSLTVCRTADSGSVPERLQCVFAAPWLITLKRGTIWIPIWPDSVPAGTWRRLWVHLRWSSGRPPADLPAGSAPGQT
jgi:hypothetical protein